jgi:hypothetical protein
MHMHSLLPIGVGIRQRPTGSVGQFDIDSIMLVVVVMIARAAVVCGQGDMRGVRLIAAVGVRWRCRHGTEVR